MFWINRTMCEVLKEMRELNDKLSPMTVEQHKATMAYLIEEVQSMGNRMEAGLNDVGDLESVRDEYSKERKKYDKLKKEVIKLEEKKEELEDES